MKEKLDWNNGWSRKSDDAKSSAIAPNYSRTESYQVGDLVMYNGQLYKNTTAIGEGGERWNPAHWELTDAVSVAKESGNKEGLSTALDNNHYSVEIAGREYRCTKIGNQLWMSENLDAEVGTLGTDETTEGANEWYYNYDEAFAKSRNYGRLYTWDNLNTNLAGKLAEWGLVTEDGKGWHWPSNEDFEKLMENINAPIGMDEDDEETYLTGGTKLKSSIEWYTYEDSKQGDDNYGFSALPAGNYAYGGGFYSAGETCNVWSSSENDGNVFGMALYNGYEGAYLEGAGKHLAFPVRCVLDLNPDGTIPDDFKSFVKIKSASAAENLVQSNTIHTPEVFGEDDTGTPISQVFEQYKTSGSLRVLMKDNSDVEVVCEANVDIIHASAGDTMMLWIDNPDVPNGKILYELDDGMTSWPGPYYYENVTMAYLEGLRFAINSISSSSWTGAVTTTAVAGKLNYFGEIPAAVTGLTVDCLPEAAPFVTELVLQFTLATGTTFTSLAINMGTTVCKIVNAPDTWESGKTYQVTMINGCAVVGVFE